MKKEIIIEGMTCNHCKMRVEKAFMSLEAVDQVEVILEEQKAVVIFNQEVANQVIIDLMDDAGYDMKKIDKC